MEGPVQLEYVQSILMRLLQTPSPSGAADQAVSLVEEEAKHLGYATMRNRKGGLLITIPGADSARQRLVTAHVDTLGAMVKDILPTGQLRLSKIGGYAWNTIEGEYCTVHLQNGDTVSGTVMLQNTSVHVNHEVGTAERKDDNIVAVLDAKVSSREAVRALGVQVGDFVSLDPRATQTATGFIKSRHLDDKASVATLLGVLREIHAQNMKLPHTTTVLISNNEEIGYGGNSNIPPEVTEYLAVDMGAIGDGQATTEYCVSICAKDASGPYHLGLRRHLTELAERLGLEYAIDIYPYYNSDASAALRAGYDVAHGLIGPGVANSHAYERTHADALQNTFALLLAYLQSPLLDL